MGHIAELKTKPLTPVIVLDIHRRITDQTSTPIKQVD